MWSVALKILSILGIILLILLGILLAALLLVLFMPAVYRASGSAHAGEYRFCFRFRWLFGLVRGEFTYPGDGALRIKALWLTLFDSGAKRRDARDSEAVAENGKKPESAEKTKAADSPTDSDGNAKAAESPADFNGNAKAAESPTISGGNAKAAESPTDSNGNVETAEFSQSSAENTDMAGSSQNSGESEKSPKSPQGQPQGQENKPEEPVPREPLFAKLSGLKEKIQPYLAIVRDEDNQALVRHALGRLGRILKSIRPRVLRLEALIGTGEPDTTGYIYGAFWTVKPFLGRKCRFIVTPDFEKQVLEGEVFLRGHVMSVVLLHHIVRVIIDKRLRQLLDQLKKLQAH